MATYQFESGGKTYAFDAPDDMSEAEAMAQAEAMVPKTVVDRFEGHLNRLMYGLREPVQSAAQGLRNITPQPIRNAVDQVDPWLYQNTGGVLGHPKADYNQTLQDQEQAYQQTQAPEGVDWMRMGGNVLAGLPMAAMEAPGLAGAAIMGGASGLLNPVYNAEQASDPVEYLKNKLLQGTAGAVTGGALHAALAPFVGGLTGQKGLQELRDAGVNPTVGQAMGGWVNNLEEKAMSMPIVGDAIRMSRQSARDEFNNATINKALEPLGQRVNDAGHTAIGAAHNLIDDAYDAARGAVTPFVADTASMMKVPSVDQLSRAGLREFRNHIRTLTQGYGALDGQLYKSLDSDLARLTSTYGASTSAQDKLIGQALGEARDQLKAQAQAASPELQNLMKKADTAFANMVRVDSAANKAGLQGGVFTPGQLINAVKATDRSARKNQFAEGEALLQKWATKGQMLGDKYPDSGTPGRILGMGGALAGLTHYTPHGLAATLLASAAAHPTAQGVLIDMLTQHPDMANKIIQQLLPLTSGAADRELGR